MTKFKCPFIWFKNNEILSQRKYVLLQYYNQSFCPLMLGISQQTVLLFKMTMLPLKGLGLLLNLNKEMPRAIKKKQANSLIYYQNQVSYDAHKLSISTFIYVCLRDVVNLCSQTYGTILSMFLLCYLKPNEYIITLIFCTSARNDQVQS